MAKFANYHPFGRRLPNGFILRDPRETLRHYNLVHSYNYLLEHYPAIRQLLHYGHTHDVGHHEGGFNPHHQVFDTFNVGRFHIEWINLGHHDLQRMIQIENNAFPFREAHHDHHAVGVHVPHFF